MATVNKTAMESVRMKLGALKGDIQESKIRTRIDSIEKIDGKLKANFSISGYESKDYPGYRDIPKIFDNWQQLSDYADKFFSASDDELKKMCKSK